MKDDCIISLDKFEELSNVIKSEADKFYREKTKNLSDELRFLIIKNIMDLDSKEFSMFHRNENLNQVLNKMKDYYNKRNKIIEDTINLGIEDS